MELILLKTVPQLGDIGDIVHVRTGYARNYLVPGGMAERVTPQAMAALDARRQELVLIKQQEQQTAHARARELQGLHIRIAKLAGEEGKLYGSVTVADVVAALAELGHEVTDREVHLPENTLKQIDEYTVQLMLHAEVTVDIALAVVAEQSDRR